MKFYDYVRMDVNEEVENIARELGVTIVSKRKRIFEERDPGRAKNLLGKAKVIFISFVPDEAFLSLAKQKNVFVGIFLSEVNERSLGKYVEILRLLQGARIPILLATGAKEITEMRSGMDMATLGVLLGLRKENAVTAVSRRWGEILEAP